MTLVDRARDALADWERRHADPLTYQAEAVARCKAAMVEAVTRIFGEDDVARLEFADPSGLYADLDGFRFGFDAHDKLCLRGYTCGACGRFENSLRLLEGLRGGDLATLGRAVELHEKLHPECAQFIATVTA